MTSKSDSDPYRPSKTPCQRCLQSAFGSLDPVITRWPHYIFPPSKEAIHAIAAEMGEPIGVFGNALPRLDAQGEAYAPPWEGMPSEDFGLWSIPANQEWAYEFAEKPPTFVMSVPVATPLDLLDQMAREGRDEYGFNYHRCMLQLPEWIERLRWAYIPLESEGMCAVFVTAKAKWRDCVRVGQALTAKGTSPLFQVREVAGEQRWDGPPFLE